MSEHKHTPGIWEATRGGELMPEDERIIQSTIGFNASGFRQIRTIARTFDNAGPEQSLANARLIAAAPMLLEALRDDLSAWENVLEYRLVAPSYRAGVGFRIAKIRAAISAATGDE